LPFINFPKGRNRAIFWFILLAVVVALASYFIGSVNWLPAVFRALTTWWFYHGATFLKYSVITIVSVVLARLSEKMWPVFRGIAWVGTSIIRFTKWTATRITRLLKSVFVFKKRAFSSYLGFATGASGNPLRLIILVTILFFSCFIIITNLDGILSSCKFVFDVLQIGLVLGRFLWIVLEPTLLLSWIVLEPILSLSWKGFDWCFDWCLWLLLGEFSWLPWHKRFPWLELAVSLVRFCFDSILSTLTFF